VLVTGALVTLLLPVARWFAGNACGRGVQRSRRTATLRPARRGRDKRRPGPGE